ncbi:hypothetical protein CONPUDRAFT_46875 [Coniophora puteana RWD-64-598 SS2]|uniref:BTB domain-containing protein n=1 Tax=Coniophora puteana (strain RWD-64-598) TaxID=741705 RepID=A0A5M3N416_CONPW|nr:uncharacterized protein CONPUDRAFT_46875 [Coniophora puteana RWD-64-598 SS2]EIW86036.1 hypothetical protein CONPUDRAFT_46875 [Coniophora puteana RWD-64-598 SS2]
MHSSVFDDMFTLPDLPVDSTDSSNLYKGRSIVRMYDKPQDVRSLLRFYYHASMFPLTRYDPETPSKIEGILRLAKKYQIDSVWHRLVHQVEADWPTSLPEWDQLKGEIELRHSRRMEENLPDELPHNDDVYPEPGAAISLAREFCLYDILPAAFYHLSRTQISCNRAAKTDDQGVSDNIAEIHEDGGRTANWSYLTRNDFKCLLLGRERIQRFMESKALQFQNSSRFADCDLGCDRRGIETKFQLVLQSSDVLAGLKGFITEDYATDGVCSPCISRAKRDAQTLRQDVWAKLPQLFDLPMHKSGPWVLFRLDEL